MLNILAILNCYVSGSERVFVFFFFSVQLTVIGILN